MVSDWLWFGATATWCTGLAVILGTLSYHDWRARSQNIKLKTQVNTLEAQLGIMSGLIIMGLGFALITTVRWQKGLWLIFVMLQLVQAARYRQRLMKKMRNG